MDHEHWRRSAPRRIRAALRRIGIRVVAHGRSGYEAGATVELMGWAAASRVYVSGSLRAHADLLADILDAAEQIGHALGYSVERLGACVALGPEAPDA